MMVIHNVAVIGAGILGHSIAQKFATEGFTVRVYDINKQNLVEAKEHILNNLTDLKKSSLLIAEENSVMARLSFHTELPQALREADLVIEAVTENLEVKIQVLQQIETAVRYDTIIASNTSSLMPSEYNRTLEHKHRVLGAHFFNPPHLLPLVELIPSEETSVEVCDVLFTTLRNMKMHPIRVNKETPGFIGNRLQFALLSEAIALVEEGVCSPEDVDKVVKYGFGRRLSVMGPFEVFDFGGWDTIARVHPNITGKKVPETIRTKVASGDFGVKTGKGFYHWNDETLTKTRKLISNIYTHIEKSTVVTE